MSLISVKEAIEDIKNGKMIVIVDDEDRENEGDLVFAGAFCDVEKVNFAITHAKGILCTPVSKEIAKRLGFDLMVRDNTSNHETAFTITVDAKEATTGVSAVERDMTIKLISNPSTKMSDFVAPGHIFPLIAKAGGVLERIGHTEGSIDLCVMAGLAPVSVICEIVNEDGTMARRDDLDEFCKKHNLNMVSIAQIVEYRLQHETLISFGDKKECVFAGYKTLCYDVKDHRENSHKVFVFGDIKEETNVKFHKVSTDLNFLTSKKYDEFMKYIDMLSKKGGVLIFLNNSFDDSENLIKEYGIGAQILRELGIKKINILSSNEQGDFAGISGFGIDIIGQTTLK
ncbi:bifunctional 3,4-dihydroxy-2-butanone-4-phosphate synthase / GTP cyclohydrolase II protein [Campylobacter blaseri]|uniref:3,4-dihydroxy-2-butanone 4-phosphate synthase n=1 Tax=Campylobacter blaseri TaxID=2042961 RepID=A0A2P8QYF5_9BACT|nr:bifunctional 3,4-dihydroxy-2-butanone 4-phosphate synthase/GTP cyclohydrolase II [Campylobacter blaseri]PSM51286.1 bifunctional 3,4-dihydroxy-2-butanone 4-phosphate synthase/GTP cyclohydrolase II [Campylobacter blaseri]PSM52430.1 bifunctional 3,4-dihydroxy-2-butanone 4-phosphate synthase/GTP cyclohydrolase II [Campylobacter blaseri]QKF86241.1 bifunctional 3,4-dihydroxy-2-butanone-4-phosphate synthase / GTP cyclohydrolase II protein [Campylobacter blaseri]